MMTNYRSSQRVFFAIMAVAFLLAVPLSMAVAAPTVTLGFDGDGVWPKEATANSQRWFRVTVSWNSSSETIDGVDLLSLVNFNNTEAYWDGTTSHSYNAGLTDGDGVWDVPAGGPTSYGVHYSGSNPRTITIGPFSAYHYDYLVGRIFDTSQGGTTGTIRVRWSTSSGPQTPVSASVSYTTAPLADGSYGSAVHNSGEMQAWGAHADGYLDPLTVVRGDGAGTRTGDNGAGGDEFEFRVKHYSGYANWPEIPSTWRLDGDDRPNEGRSYCVFDQFAYDAIDAGTVPGTTGGVLPHGSKTTRSDSSYNNWMYSNSDDPYLDSIGDGGRGSMDPEPVLIVDRQYNAPLFMTEESGSSLRNGVIYKYNLRPSNLLQTLRNIFTLQFDPAGIDTWDSSYSGVRGYPTANGYVAMRSGGHVYEFLTSRDFDPPVWSVPTTEQDGSPHIGKLSVALRGRPGDDLQAINFVRDWTSGERFTLPQQTWIDDDGAGGYGYAQNSQDFTQYPKVDPVLTAHPWFHSTADPTPAGPLTGTGPNPEYNFTNAERGYPNSGQQSSALGPDIGGAYPNPFNPYGRDDGGSETYWPWGRIAGPIDSGVIGGYADSITTADASPRRFTNEDTIYPNFVNIYPDTHENAYQGGKWTTDSNFMFRINYWQSDNLAPQYVQLFVRKVDDSGNPVGGGSWMQYTMLKANPSDFEMRDGTVYYFEASGTELGGPGDYQYYFKASDYNNSTIFPNRTSNDPGSLGVAPGDNDYYWFRVNNKPQLSDQTVSPASAPIGSNFAYQITYTDADGEMDPDFGAGEQARDLGDRPFRSWLHLDYSGDANPAQITDITDNPSPTPDVIEYTAAAAHAAGELSNMQVRLDPNYEMNVANDDLPGNWVISDNSRTTATTGTIAVADATGLAVGDTIRIWLTTSMVPVDDSDKNYRDGAVYTYNTAQAGIELAAGVHRYYFEFWDDWATWVDWQQYFMDDSVLDPTNQKVAGQKVRHPSAGFHEGPEVIENTPPHLSRYYFEAPVEDEVATGGVGATSVNYSRPTGLDPYADNSLNGMYLQVVSGDAAGYIYEIDNNAGDAINFTGTAIAPATGNPANDGVAAGNAFRVFEHRTMGDDGRHYLSFAHDTPAHGDPVAPDQFEGTSATPFYVYLTYTDAENNPPSVLKVQIDDDPSQTYNMEKVNPGDNVYADGVEYRTTTAIYLTPGANPTLTGSHTIKAQAYDGTAWYGSQSGYSATPNADTFFGPLTSVGDISVPANGPDINANSQPILDFEVGRGTVDTASDSTGSAPAQITYIDSGTGADAIGENPVVTVEVDLDGDATFDVEYRVVSHDPDTNTLVLEGGAQPETDLVANGDTMKVNVRLDPPSGLETDTYTYWVEYTDEDDYAGVQGNPPEYVSVFIDNVEYPMNEYDPDDDNMTDGKLYYYSTDTLSISENHQYYFMTSDGLDTRRLPQTAPSQYDGPVVHVNNAPELSAGAVDPQQGTEEDPPGTPKPYRFTVTYTDPDNHAPGEVLLHIRNTSQSGASWLEFTMAPDPTAGNDGSFTDGEVYFAEAFAFKAGANQIGDGDHEFYFTAEDIHGLSDRYPASSASPSELPYPTINDAPAPPTGGFSPQSPDFPASQSTDDLVVIDDTTPRIEWTAAVDPNATDSADTLHYVVQISDTRDDFSSALELTTGDGENFVVVPGTDELSDKESYFYRVQTVDDDGVVSDPAWSTSGGDPFDAVTAFRVNTNHPPYWDAPTIDQFTPSGDVNTLTPTLSWPDGADPDAANPPGSLKYRVQVDDNPDFNDPEFDSGVGYPIPDGQTSVIVDDTPGNGAVDAAVLQWGVTYYWRVLVYDGEFASDWTNELTPAIEPSFNTIENARPTPPTDPFVPSGGTEVESRQPTFSWGPGADAEDDASATDFVTYEVQVDDDNDWSNGHAFDAVTTDEDDTDINSILLPTTDNRQYWWRVRTVDSGGRKSNWSATKTFWLNLANDPPNPPAGGFLPTPAAGETEVWLPDPPGNAGVDPLMWDPATDPDHSDDPEFFDDRLRYTVELSTDIDFATVPHELTTDWGVTEMTVPDDLTRGVKWYWRVIAEDDDNAVSAPSHAAGAADMPGFWVNRASELSNGSVAPVVAGDIGEDDGFRFEVTYTDPDDQAPESIEVVVTPHTPATGTPVRFAMQEVGTTHDYPGGEAFEVVVTGDEMGDGDHTFYFEATDGIQPTVTRLYDPARPADTEFDGPTVNDEPNPVDSGFSPADADPPTIVFTRSPTIDWDAADDPNTTDTAALLRYRVEFSQGDHTAAFTVEDAYTRTTGQNVTTATPLASLPIGVWRYRIITIDDDAAESDPSEAQVFEVRLNHDPNAPTPIDGYEPANGADVVETTPLLNWPDGTDQDAGDSAGNLHYEVQLDDEPSFTAPTVFDGATADGVSEHQVATALTVGSQYYWRVRTVDDEGATSEWSTDALGLSEPLTFRVVGNQPPNPPTTGFDPTDGEPVFSLQPTLNWDDGTDDLPDPASTLHYQVQVDDNDDWTDANVVDTTTADGITEVTLGTALTENAQYWYRVRTIDDEGAESDWSTSQLFWVNSVNDDPLPPSSGFSPNNGAETELQRPPLNWNAGTDPDDPSSAARQTDTAGTFTYTVQLAAQSDIATNGFDYQYSTSAPGETQLIPGDSLADETTWYWRVRTVDDEGATSDWSLEQHFNVNTNNQPPVLSDGAVTPVMGDLDTTFEFSVVYTDAENDAPIDDIMVHVGANSLDLAMVRDPNDNDDFSEGVTYLASVRGDNAELGLGGFEHHYYIAGTEIRYPDAPETVFGPVVAAAGTIRLTDSAWADTDTYEEGDTVYIEVADADENQDPAAPDTVEVTVTGDGDSETVTLTETGNDTGVYQGQLAMLGAAGSADDGQLNVVAGPSGSQITAIWADPDETPLGVTPATDEATVSDTIAPNSIAAGELVLSSINEGRAALIDWQAYDETAQPNNQPDVAAYHIWQSDTDFTDTADATRIATVPAGTQTHEVTGLNLGEEYFFAVSVADEVPNEDTSVVAKSVLTNDTDAPVVENWQYDAEAGTLSFDLTDASGVDMSMFALRVDGTDVTGDATWDDSDIVQVSVDYAAPNGWGYNRQVDFAVDIADIHGNAATYDFQEDAPIDDTLPTADQFTPADGDDNASAGTEISARLRDTESGVDSDTVIMTVNGDDVSDELTFPETAAAEGEAELRVSYQPAEPLTYATEYTVHLEFADAVGNVATADWTFTVEDEPMFEIRGTVTDEDGDPMAGVEVTVDGRTVGTDGNGAYTVSDLSAGDYTVTPSLADYTFDPASREVTVGPDANDIDFIGRLQTYAISGQITRGGTGVEGVTVSDGTRTATTDADGHYTINDVPSGSYAVTPSRDADDDGMEDFNYTPSSRTVTVQGAPETDVDFTATLVTYSISGLITDTSGNRVAGVSVTDGTRTAITNESGQYTISDVPPSTVTVTATKTGLAFDPESTEVTVPPDGTGVNFTAYTEFRQRFQAGVHMVGVPATPPSGRDRAVDIFGTDNVARWDAEGSPAGYVFGTENPDASQLQIRPGVGLFVNFAGVTDVTVPGDPVPDTAASSVGVATGWNQVGNMYQTALPMANISGAGSTQLRPFAFVWDNSVGSYRMISREPAFNSARTYIEAWEAAWFKTTGAAGSLNIEGPANVAAASLLEGAAARSEAPDNGWLVEVVARVADRADVTSVAGVGSGDASRGYRIENPPMMPGSVDVYFTDESGARLAHDIRPQSSGAMVWPFCVETDIADAEVEMTLPDLSGVPNDMAVYLTDVDSGKRMYARTLPAYTFNTGADGALRHFELEVAPRGADNLAIRTASVQAGSGGLMVTYDLSSAANVSIEVMNIAGRSVRTLIESRAVSAGSNEQMWDMRSADGTVVPNGSYLIKIEAVADNGQRVQALRPAQIAR